MFRLIGFFVLLIRFISTVKIQFGFWFILLLKWLFYTFWLMGRCFDYDSHLYLTEQAIVFILRISWQFILWICNGALLSYDALRRRNLIKGARVFLKIKVCFWKWKCDFENGSVFLKMEVCFWKWRRVLEKRKPTGRRASYPSASA